MRKLLYLTAILIQFGLQSKAQTVPDVIRTPVTPSSGASRNNRASSDANLYVPYSLRIPRASAFTLNGAKDSIGYIMFNTTSNRLGVYRGSGVWDTYSISTDGVSSFNGRTGSVTLANGDVTTALGFTPYDATNPAGYISSETDPTVPIYAKSLTAFSIIKTSTDALYPSLTGSYTNPTWIASLAYSKLTGAPDLSVYELLSNKSSSPSLGTSNTLYPTQNAVKTYVDNTVASGYVPLLQLEKRPVGTPAYTLADSIDVHNGLDNTSNIGSLRNFYTGGLASKKIAVFGNSTVAAANEFFTTLATYARPGKGLNGLPVTPVVINGGTGWVTNCGNIYNYGYNGETLASILVNGHMDALIAFAPDMVIWRGPLINDVRTGVTSLDSARKLLSTALIRFHKALPNTVILLDVENSLLQTDPTSTGFVVVIPTTETKVDGGTSGVTAVGSHIVQVATMPTSLYNGGQVYINFGLADQEIVNITALTDTTFTGTFTKTHTQGFAAKATLASAGQAYSTIIRRAVVPFFNSYGNLTGLDMQTLLYGLNSPVAAGGYMLDPLHPNAAGRTAEANIVGNFLTKAQYRISQYAINDDLYHLKNGVDQTLTTSGVGSYVFNRKFYKPDSTFFLKTTEVVSSGDVSWKMSVGSAGNPTVDNITMSKNNTAFGTAITGTGPAAFGGNVSGTGATFGTVTPATPTNVNVQIPNNSTVGAINGGFKLYTSAVNSDPTLSFGYNTTANMFYLQPNFGAGTPSLALNATGGSVVFRKSTATGFGFTEYGPANTQRYQNIYDPSGAFPTSNQTAGGMAAVGDKLFMTITTGLAQKEFTMNDATLTSTFVPYATSGNRLTPSSTDLTHLTYLNNVTSDIQAQFTADNLDAVTTRGATTSKMMKYLTTGGSTTSGRGGEIYFDGTNFNINSYDRGGTNSTLPMTFNASSYLFFGGAGGVIFSNAVTSVAYRLSGGTGIVTHTSPATVTSYTLTDPNAAPTVNGQVMSFTTSGTGSWVTPFSNPMTTLGDVIYGGASGVPTRLAGETSTSRKFLSSVGSAGVSSAPTFYDLYGNPATWGAQQTFGAGIQTAGTSTLNATTNIGYGQNLVILNTLTTNQDYIINQDGNSTNAKLSFSRRDGYGFYEQMGQLYDFNNIPYLKTYSTLDLTALTTSHTASLTSASGTHSYMLSYNTNITSNTGGVGTLTSQVRYTNESGNTTTLVFYQSGSTAAAQTGTGSSDFPVIEIKCASGTGISIDSTVSGTITYNKGFSLIQTR